MQEEWRPVAEWEDTYEVSTEGVIRRKIRKGRHPAGSVVSGSLHSKGYRVVGFTRNNRMSHHYVHRVVCEAFIGPCPEECEVNHIDGNKINNRLSNLEYITHKKNMEHACQTGLYYKGFKRKLKPEEIREIRAFDPSASCRKVGSIYGVSADAVSRIRRGDAWKWIK